MFEQPTKYFSLQVIFYDQSTSFTSVKWLQEVSGFSRDIFVNYDQVTVKKRLSVTTDERVCQDLDTNEAQDVVLDISKAFHKVW